MAVNRIGPPCPACNCLTTDVVRTVRSTDGGFHRSRICPSCNHKFFTIQPKEIITDGKGVTWQRRKITIDWSQVSRPNEA